MIIQIAMRVDSRNRSLGGSVTEITFITLQTFGIFFDVGAEAVRDSIAAPVLTRFELLEESVKPLLTTWAELSWLYEVLHQDDLLVLRLQGPRHTRASPLLGARG